MNCEANFLDSCDHSRWSFRVSRGRSRIFQSSWCGYDDAEGHHDEESISRCCTDEPMAIDIDLKNGLRPLLRSLKKKMKKRSMSKSAGAGDTTGGGGSGGDRDATEMNQQHQRQQEEEEEEEEDTAE